MDRYLPTYVPTYLPTYLPPYIHACMHACISLTHLVAHDAHMLKYIVTSCSFAGTVCELEITKSLRTGLAPVHI